MMAAITDPSPMSVPRTPEPVLDAEERFEGFENLMPFKVHNILLVSSLYDSFILREDGRLNELLIDESLELNLQHIPGITHVSSCAEALDLAGVEAKELGEDVVVVLTESRSGPFVAAWRVG